MSEDSHVIPLAPPQIHRSSDEESDSTTKTKDTIHHKQGSSSKCFVYILLLLVLVSIALLVFGSVVLRIKAPRLKAALVEIKNLEYASNSGFASLNMIMVAQIKIDNANFGRFKFKKGSTSVVYGNTILGTTNIKGGLVRGRNAKRINVTIQVKGNNGLAENMNFSSDLGSGLVKLSSYAKLRGEVRLLKFISRHRASFMNCSMSLDLPSQAVLDLRCM